MLLAASAPDYATFLSALWLILQASVIMGVAFFVYRISTRRR